MYKILIALFLVICIASLTSCYTIKQFNPEFKKISVKDIDLEIEQYNNCEVFVFYDKKTKKTLNGKYKYKNEDRSIEFINMLNGKYHGLREVYKRGTLYSLTEYRNGVKDGIYICNFNPTETSNILRITEFSVGYVSGIESVYENNNLTEKYVNKKGKTETEYRFNINGDTLIIYNYEYDPDFLNNDIINFLEEHDIDDVEFKGKIYLDLIYDDYSDGNTYDYYISLMDMYLRDINNDPQCGQYNGAYLVIFSSGHKYILCIGCGFSPSLEEYSGSVNKGNY